MSPRAEDAAAVAAKLRALADRIEKGPSPISATFIASGGEAQFHYSVRGLGERPDGFGPIRYAVFLGDWAFVDESAEKHRA